MSNQSYKLILEKYKNGAATEEELKLLEKYADEMIARNKTQVFFSEDDKEIIKNELRQRVKVRPLLNRSSWIKVAAASIALIVGLTIAFWLNNDNLTSPEMAFVTTGVGEQKSVTLSDRSEIILNAESSLEYPKAFKASERAVVLNGEAIFKVAKDADRPFKVHSNGVTTTVLGTIFNINGYTSDSAVTVSLLEGSVRVEGLNESLQIVPMQESTFDLKTKTINVAAFDSFSVIAWQTGDLVFAKTSFSQLQRLVKRKYGVEIVFNKPEIANYTISGKFRDPDLTTLLKAVCAAKSLDYKRTENDKVLLYTE